jgi:hypothetical protein
MPCDSAGAALVTLGAVQFRLSLADANEVDAHFQRIQRAADEAPGTIFLRQNVERGRFVVRGRNRSGEVYVEQDPPPRRGRYWTWIFPHSATSWTFEGEAPVQVLDGGEIPYGAFYNGFLNGAPPLFGPNLRRSDSAVCLAGRITGETASRSIATSIRFYLGKSTADLTQLLTIHRWSGETASRAVFFNTRTEQFDSHSGLPRLVIADGDQAFLRVLAGKAFQNSHVIGVLHRVIERERLEAIAVKIQDLGQWYDEDGDFLNQLGVAPHGLTISVLRRR